VELAVADEDEDEGEDKDDATVVESAEGIDEDAVVETSSEVSAALVELKTSEVVDGT
jgi:hypothetical protein